MNWDTYIGNIVASIDTIRNHIGLINTDISGLSHHIDTEIQGQKDYTDQEIEPIRNEGLIQEAVTQIVAWIISDEGNVLERKYGTGKKTNG